MKENNIQFILTDIEGTTTSVSFVYESLFPYFRTNIGTLKNLQQLPEVQKAFEQTVELAKKEGVFLGDTDQIIQQLTEGRTQLLSQKTKETIQVLLKTQ